MSSGDRIIFLDIDGVLADCTHRLCHLEDKDYDEFYRRVLLDPPYQNNGRDFIKNIETFYGGRVVYLTGRPERTRDDTKEWLAKNYNDSARTLLTRKNRDWRRADLVKPELASKYVEENGIKSCVIIDDQYDNVEGVIDTLDILHPEVEAIGVCFIQPRRANEPEHLSDGDAGETEEEVLPRP